MTSSNDLCTFASRSGICLCLRCVRWAPSTPDSPSTSPRLNQDPDTCGISCSHFLSVLLTFKNLTKATFPLNIHKFTKKMCAEPQGRADPCGAAPGARGMSGWLQQVAGKPRERQARLGLTFPLQLIPVPEELQ